ncbi:MAG: hypothetical protein LBS90_02290 [Oscillospiraceae bacterium]|nr:hypothetical protein [Oscillospiraceae bacterium]
MKKILAIVLAVVLVTAMAIPLAVSAASYKTVDEAATAVGLTDGSVYAADYVATSQAQVDSFTAILKDTFGLTDDTANLGEGYTAPKGKFALLDWTAFQMAGTWTFYVDKTATPVAPAEPTPAEPDPGEIAPPVTTTPDTQPANPPVQSPDTQPANPPTPTPGVSVPTPEAPASTAAKELTTTVDGLKFTFTGLQSNWYNFDIGLIFGAAGGPYTYALYFDNGATVTFGQKTTVSTVDATTYETTTKDYSAGQTVTIKSINGSGVTLSDSNTVTFVLASDPGNFVGIVADTPLSAFPGTIADVTVAAPSNPPTGDAQILLFAALGLAALAGTAVAVAKKSKSR